MSDATYEKSGALFERATEFLPGGNSRTDGGGMDTSPLPSRVAVAQCTHPEHAGSTTRRKLTSPLDLNFIH